MIRTIRNLSISFVILGATSFVLAPAGLAAEFHAEGSPSVNVTGQQVQQFNLRSTGNGAETKCSQVLFEGTVQGGGGGQTTAQELTLTPTLTGCKTTGLTATAEVNGCKFTITAASQLPNTTLVDIAACTAGKVIQVKITGCTITIPEQTAISHAVGQSNAGPPKNIEVNTTLQGITYEFHGIACPGPTPAPTQLGHDSDLTGQATFTAFADNGTELATHLGHQYNKLKLGTQLGLSAT